MNESFTEICYLGSHWQYAGIVSDNGLVPIRQQAIFWTNDGTIYWRIYALLEFNELTMPDVKLIW